MAVEPELQATATSRQCSALAGETCRAALALLPPATRSSPLPQVEWLIPWYDTSAGPGRPAAEATVQAEVGLMHVHGLRWGGPRRLGLDVASVAAGLLAAQGVMAAKLAGLRGGRVGSVEVPVTAGALTFLRHHVAIATCGQSWPPGAPDQRPGTPLRTADGHLVELEALGIEQWSDFWRRLGVASELEAAWMGFVFRFLTARSSLPGEFHQAAARHPLSVLQAAAAQAGMAVCRVRGYAEVIGDGIEPLWTIKASGPAAARVSAGVPRPEAPLAGLKVVEITTRLQGPLAGVLLGSLGAEVTKIEPVGGDFGKHNPPRAGSLGAAYVAYNAGKTSLEVDYKEPAGVATIRDLVRDADVFLHNWRPGRAEKLSLDHRTLSRLRPGLVYVEASGWGTATDPPAPFATDCLVQAHAGCGDGLNPVGRLPFPSLLPLTDVAGALLAATATLAGLCRREREGAGCLAQTSLMAGAAALQAKVLDDWRARREGRRQAGRPAAGPLSDPVRTADGWLAVAPGAAAYSRLASRAWETRTTGEWEAELLEAGVPAAAVAEDLAALPAFRPAWFQRVDGGGCNLPAAPWKFDA